MMALTPMTMELPSTAVIPAGLVATVDASLGEAMTAPPMALPRALHS